jgi:hypothetical protein
MPARMTKTRNPARAPAAQQGCGGSGGVGILGIEQAVGCSLDSKWVTSKHATRGMRMGCVTLGPDLIAGGVNASFFGVGGTASDYSQTGFPRVKAATTCVLYIS